MNRTDDKKATTPLAVHPELRRNLLANPTQKSLNTVIEYRLLDQPSSHLTKDVLDLLPLWEQQACAGNEVLAALIQYIEQHHAHFIKNDKTIRSNLLRIRILAATPGGFTFPPLEIQEHLFQFLRTADILADLPEFDVVAFSEDEIAPLATDITNFRLTPHTRRYIQNLFHPERREAILSVLAHLAKNYPLLLTCRKAYALMLSLDNPDLWGKHPFCLRLVINRFWDYRLKESAK